MKDETRTEAQHRVLSRPIFGDAAARHVELDRQYPPFENAAAGIDELQRRLTRMRAAWNDRDHLSLRRELVNLVAHGARLSRDCGIETEAQAVLLDDAELDRRPQ
jgi:hypothetical protein